MRIFSAKWFPVYAWYDPDGRTACIMLLAALFLALIAICWAQSSWRSCSDDLFDLEQQLLPVHTFSFSPQGEVEVYEEGVRVMRSGTCVSPMLSNIWELSDKGGPKDRVLSVRWLAEDGPRTTDVRLGPVDRTSLDKLKDIMEHYGKG